MVHQAFLFKFLKPHFKIKRKKLPKRVEAVAVEKWGMVSKREVHLTVMVRCPHILYYGHY